MTVFADYKTYAMSTSTRVPTLRPEDNEFGHDGGGVVFLYLRNEETGKGLKVLATYGSVPAVGTVLPMVQDTGLGSKRMAPHRVIATKEADKPVQGFPPQQKSLPFYVAK